MDCFNGSIVHVLDIPIDKTDTELYYKSSHTGQYSSFNSNPPRNYKTSWIRSLYQHAKNLCSLKEKLKWQSDKIKLFMLSILHW